MADHPGAGPSPAGRITGTTGLATFRRRWSIAERLRDWRNASRERRSRRPLNRQWLTGLMFASATAFLSGALGLVPGVADNWRKNGLGGGGQIWTAWLAGVFGLTGLVLLAVAAWRWWRRGVIVDARGTAYVIEEQAVSWRHEEKVSVLTEIGEQFAAVLRVPGPAELGERWRWEADAGGCPQWDAHADALVRSFWSVHYNDNHVTHNAVFAWAPWPVAMAFGARATARRRGLVLHVRQRPSFGANGARQHLRIEDGAHDFLPDTPHPPLPEAAPQHSVQTRAGSVRVTFENHGPPAAAVPGTAQISRPVRLLVVRLVDGPIGDLPLGTPEATGAVSAAPDPAVSLYISADLAETVIPAGIADLPFDEWRLTCAADPAPHVPWLAYPSIAATIAGWIEGKAAAHPGEVFLLATRIPQELAVGLGIQLGQRTQAWPQHMFPVHFAGGRLIVPSLRIGACSVPGER